MKNFWYVEHWREILIDMDRPEKSTDHFLRRLNGAIQSGKLNVAKIEMHNSWTGNHLHVMLTLEEYIRPIEKRAWEIILHSDIYRAACNIMRLSRYPEYSPVLLITPFAFDRKPDAICECTQKHKLPVMETCLAARVLRGKYRMETFFGKPSERAEIPNVKITSGFELSKGRFLETESK